jgi:hypothetical protein
MGAFEMVTFTNPQANTLDMLPGPAHQNISIVDNFIADPGRAGVWLANTLGGNVSGNYLLHPNERPDLAYLHPPETDIIAPIIVHTNSSGISVGTNTVDSTSGVMFATDTQYRELAAYPPGGTVKLNALNLGALPDPAVTLTDADGVIRNAAIVQTTAHAIDIALPANAGLGGAYIKLTSGNMKYFGTLFLDSQDNTPALNGCTYQVSVPPKTIAATAGSFQALVITQAGCVHQAIDGDSFVTVGGQTAGTGILSVGFAANGGAARTTTIEFAGVPIKVTQDSAVAAVSVTPFSGAGTTQTFVGLYSDTNGFSDINTVMLNINTTSSLAGGCTVRYVRASNQMFLRNDADTTWTGPGTPGTGGILQNSQCALNLQVSSILSSGNNLTLNVALTFSSALRGQKSTFLNVTNNSNLSTGWLEKGTWYTGNKSKAGQLTSQ